MKNQGEIIRNYFSLQEICILNMYEFLNKELINNFFEIDSDSLSFFVEYFKNEDDKLFDKIWKQNSIQKEIFIFCKELYIHFSQDKIQTKNEFFKKFNRKIEKSLLISIFQVFYDTLYSCYTLTYQREENNNSYNYFDENFGVYYLKNCSSVELREFYTNQDLSFYIVLDGLVKYKNKLIGDREVIFSKNLSFEKELKFITPTCSIIVFVLKSPFLDKLCLSSTMKDLGSFKLYSLKIFSSILRYENFNKNNYLTLFEIALYLCERIDRNRIITIDTSYFSYKKRIVDIVTKNIFLEEKEIMERMLMELDISTSTLYKIFSILFFLTPAKYIESVKISKSYYLLSNSHKTVENIAEYLGYSPKVFKEKFKTRTGYSPSEFRNLTKE